MTSKKDIFNFFSHSFQRKYEAFMKGVVFVWCLVYEDLCKLLIRQTTTLCKMTSKKDIREDIPNFFSQFNKREAYKFTLSFPFKYIKY